jgi:ABC-type glycerol-3-phosphate transport system permease component
MGKNKVIKKPPSLQKAVIWFILAVGAIVMMTPIIFMFSASFKYSDEIFSLNLFPSEPTLSNYIYLFEETSFFTWMKNSFIVSSVVTISVLFFDALIGYTLCKFRFRGRKIIFIAILSTLMIPTEMLVIPWSGFGVFLMKQFFENVPNDLIDAARIDGVGEFKIFIEIALPLVAPALSALAIFTFLGNWTAFLWPMIVTTSADLYTIPVGLASFSGEFQTEWEMIMTGAAVASLPTLFVFLFLQRYIIRGIILGSLKG